MPTPRDHKYTAEEFLKLTPENKSERYELINGEIVAQAAPSEIHQDITLSIYAELRNFIRKNNGTCKPMAAPFDVVLAMPFVYLISDWLSLSSFMVVVPITAYSLISSFT